jgi:cytochrome P450
VSRCRTSRQAASRHVDWQSRHDPAVDPEFFGQNPEAPYETYKSLRDQCPVYHDPLSGAYCVSRFDDVAAIIADPTTFSSRAHRLGALVAAKRTGSDPGEPRRTAIVHDDDPYHAWLRGLIARSFTPTAIARLETAVVAISDELLAEMDFDSPVDVVPSYTTPLPSRVIAGMYGVPPDEYLLFRGWTEGFLSPDPAVHQPATAAFNEYFSGFMEERRRHPGDDMITHLVDARDQSGDPLPDAEILAVLMQNILAGNHTSTSMIGNMFYILTLRPELWNRARSDRSMVDGIIEEVLRYESPVQWMPRVTRQAVELHGVELPVGATVIPMFGSANRDDARWSEPSEFMPGYRADAKRHLAFGRGVHSCVGQPLARLEASVALNAFLDRFSAIECAEAPVRSQGFLGVRGYSSLVLSCRS